MAAFVLTSGSAHHHTLYLCGSFSSHQWQCTPPHTISVWQLFFSPVAVHTTTHYICVAALLLTSGSAHHHTLYLCGRSSSHQWQCTPPHTISVWQLLFSPVAVHTTTHYICVAAFLLTSGSAHHHTLYLCGSSSSHQWQCTPPHTISVWQIFFSPVAVHTTTHYICVAAPHRYSVWWCALPQLPHRYSVWWCAATGEKKSCHTDIVCGGVHCHWWAAATQI